MCDDLGTEFSSDIDTSNTGDFSDGLDTASDASFSDEIEDFKEVISNLKSDEENMEKIIKKVKKCFEDNNNQVENEFLQIVKYSDKIWDEIRFLTLKNSI